MCVCMSCACVIDSTLAAAGSSAELPHSQSASDLQECTRLPLVIRERDVEYQVNNVTSARCVPCLLLFAVVLLFVYIVPPPF